MFDHIEKIIFQYLNYKYFFQFQSYKSIIWSKYHYYLCLLDITMKKQDFDILRIYITEL